MSSTLQQKYKDSASSVSIHDLEEGQRYCTKVQYIYHNKPVGLESCTQCEVIPMSSKTMLIGAAARDPYLT